MQLQQLSCLSSIDIVPGRALSQWPILARLRPSWNPWIVLLLYDYRMWRLRLN